MTNGSLNFWHYNLLCKRSNIWAKFSLGSGVRYSLHSFYLRNSNLLLHKHFTFVEMVLAHMLYVICVSHLDLSECSPLKRKKNLCFTKVKTKKNLSIKL